jgi:hypothetical protein
LSFGAAKKLNIEKDQSRVGVSFDYIMMIAVDFDYSLENLCLNRNKMSIYFQDDPMRL